MSSSSDLYRLLRRLETGHLTILQSEIGIEFQRDWHRLRNQQMVRPTVAATTAPCTDCGGNDLPVVVLGKSDSARGMPFVHCPACGLCELSWDDILRFKISSDVVVAALATAVSGINQPVDESVSGLWRLGRLSSHTRSQAAYLVLASARRLGRPTYEFFKRNPKSILFFPTPEASLHWKPGYPETVLGLSDFVIIDHQGMAFDHAHFASSLRGTAEPKPKLKSPKKRSTRAVDIEKLTKALSDHLLLARAHAEATRAREGVAQLLRRPYQYAIGRRAEVEEYSVTRCFADPTAKMLRLMWKAANDLDQVLDWIAPTRQDPDEDD